MLQSISRFIPRNARGTFQQCILAAPTRRFCYQAEFASSLEISPKDAVERSSSRDDVFVIDVRNADEIEKKAVPLKRVYNIPTHLFFDAASAKQAEKSIEEILPQPLRPKNTEIITVCKAGIRSKHVSNLLVQLGWTKVFNMTGGMNMFAVEVEGNKKPEPS